MAAKLALSVSVAEPKPKRTANVEGGRIVIGSGTEADLHVDDPRVSPLHAAIEGDEAGGLTLVDLGSATGTFVRGERITRKKVEVGDRIEIGSSELELLSAEPVLKAESASYREPPQVERVEVQSIPEPIVRRPRPGLWELASRWWPLLGLIATAIVYVSRFGFSLPHTLSIYELLADWPPTRQFVLSLLLGFAVATGDSIARDSDGSRTPLGRLLLVLAALVAAPSLLSLAIFLFMFGGMALGIIVSAVMVVYGVIAVVRWIARGDRS